MARDKELSTFTTTTIGLGASYEFGRSWKAIERGSINLSLDWMQYDYEDFSDVTGDEPLGEEPLYSFDATVTRFFASIFF